jgi:serine/threonine protein kinase
MICQVCNTTNDDAGRFCTNCGAVLELAKVPSSAASLGSAASPARESKDDDEPTLVMTAASSPTVAVEPLIGRLIEDKYRIDSKLGAGGMGAVYRAHRILIGDEVAIKILHPQHVSEPQEAERFRREAQASARLKHPNAVSIYDFGVTSDGLVYLVMELVEGQSLRQIIKQQGPVTPSAAGEVLNQVCAALDEAHRQQIVHRDLKPDNIIVNPMVSGLRVKVLDFGIAKLRDLTAGNLTQTGSVMGTPHYMSPEQCLGEELDSRSDIYSLGIVLYEMLAGVVPFNSPTSTAVVVQHVNQSPPSLRAINLSISPAVEAVVLHALAKKREDRPQTAGALATEFATALRAGTESIPIARPMAPLNPTMVLTMPGELRAGVSRATPVTGWPVVSPAKSSKVPLPLLAVVAVLLLALGAVAVLVIYQVMGNGTKSDNSTNSRPATGSGNTAPTPANAGSVSNQATPTRNSSPTPPPTVPVVNPSVARSEVMSAMNVWADSLRRRSVGDNLSLYADRLDIFYGRRNVDKGAVARNRQEIFSKYYSSTDVQLSNVSVDLDATGTSAKVFYDNTYNWMGGAHSMSGKSHNEMIMSRVNGRWLIVSEIHLQQYYESKRD